MSQMHVPVTDAFDETDQLESLQVELTPEQIEWLRDTAAERGLSIDHMLRTIVTAQMRGIDESPEIPADSGDGAMQSASASVSDNADAPPSAPDPSEATEPDNERFDPPSIVESLRSASERLQNLTENEKPSKSSGLHDTLTRLKAHMDNASDAENTSSEDDTAGTVLENQNQSMFDMMDDE